MNSSTNTIFGLYVVKNRGRQGNATHRVIPAAMVFLKMEILDDHLNVPFVDDITACGCGAWALRFDVLFP